MDFRKKEHIWGGRIRHCHKDHGTFGSILGPDFLEPPIPVCKFPKIRGPQYRPEIVGLSFKEIRKTGAQIYTNSHILRPQTYGNPFKARVYAIQLVEPLGLLLLPLAMQQLFRDLLRWGAGS